MRFNSNNPSFKVLPIDLPTTRRPIGAIIENAEFSALSRSFSLTALVKSPGRYRYEISVEVQMSVWVNRVDLMMSVSACRHALKI